MIIMMLLQHKVLFYLREIPIQIANRFAHLLILNAEFTKRENGHCQRDPKLRYCVQRGVAK